MTPRSNPVPVTTRRIHRCGALQVYVAMTALAAVVFVWVLGFDTQWNPNAPVPWVLSALGLGLAELSVVHLRVGKSAHSFTASEVVVVVALVAGRPSGVLIAAVVGPLIALLVRRQLSPLKIVFNLSQYVLTCSLTVFVYYGIGPGPSWSSAQTFGAALAATIGGSALSIVLVAGALRIAEGSALRRTLRESALPGLIVTTTNTSLGLLLLCLWRINSVAVVLLLPQVCLVLGAYRAYESLRSRNEGLRFLHDAVLGLSSEVDLETSLRSLLRVASEAFHADVAELMLHSGRAGTDGGRLLRTSPRGFETGPVDDVLVRELGLTVGNGGGAVALEADETVVGRHLRDLDLGQGAVAELRTDDRTLGLILIGHHPRSSVRLRDQDLRLLHSLAGHAALVLQNDRLELAYHELHEVHGALKHQATHDALTNLANRRVLFEQLERIAVRGGASFALLYIDLDKFKPVNDRYGHEAGDRVLVEVGRRLTQLVSVGDTLSRIGGDEFAILIDVGASPDDIGEFTRRIGAAIAEPIDIGGAHVCVGATVGVFVGAGGEVTPDEVLRRADRDMYGRKANRPASSAPATRKGGAGGAALRL